MISTSEDPLIDAIKRNDIPLTISLLSASPTPPSSNALVFAAYCGRTNHIALLLDAGVDINGMDQYKVCAYRAAMRGHHFAALCLLIQRGAITAVHDAHDVVLMAAKAYLLLCGGAPIDQLTPDNLLNLVALANSLDVLHRLLARNVNVVALRMQDGSSVLHALTTRRVWDADSDALARALVDLGADVNATTSGGVTPMYRAALKCFASAVRVFVELGADIDAQSGSGWTALHIACFGNSKSMHQVATVHLLVALGANVRLANNRGDTPLHIAAQRGDCGAMCAFAAAGADRYQANKLGITAHDNAVRFVGAFVTDAAIDDSRRQIAKIRLDLVRHRAMQVCIGLQPLNLDALQLCEIMMHACGVFAALIEFHQWWKIATTIKHFLH